jgi:hypothetical protein
MGRVVKNSVAIHNEPADDLMASLNCSIIRTNR